jgi:hypothetical protein
MQRGVVFQFLPTAISVISTMPDMQRTYTLRLEAMV